MPEITVKIIQGSTEVSNSSVGVNSNEMPDLIAALKTAKEEANTVLSKLVESSKNQKQTREASEHEEDDSSSGDDDSASVKKKQKS